jgi:phosphatidylglycerol---prolipoprotein diacylglyceryl transferase
MTNFLHTFNPSPVMISLGPIHIYWYGFFIILGVIAGLTVCFELAKLYNLKKEIIIDLAFWLIIGGLIGARLYHVGLEFNYYLDNPLSILKIWQGGIAIHGAIIGGLIALWLYTKKYGHNFWQLTAMVVTALPLAQAIGRWGNYFNQELFGRPTDSPWGIPINELNRPWQYFDYNYFHPTFFYESLGNLIIFMIIVGLHVYSIKRTKKQTPVYSLLVCLYFLLYSGLRFSLEFVRVDTTPDIFGWRFPQLISLFIIFLCLIYLTVELSRRISKKFGA